MLVVYILTISFTIIGAYVTYMKHSLFYLRCVTHILRLYFKEFFSFMVYSHVNQKYQFPATWNYLFYYENLQKSFAIIVYIIFGLKQQEYNNSSIVPLCDVQCVRWFSEVGLYDRILKYLAYKYRNRCFYLLFLIAEERHQKSHTLINPNK